MDRLLALVWRPPVRISECGDASRDVMRFRLMGSVAESGFLLSSLLLDIDASARWFDGVASSTDRPAAVRIVDARGQSVRATVVFGSSAYVVE